jgi:hypothetical protein
MKVQKYDLEICRELAKSVGWECLSTKYVNADSKLTWKCPEGHIQEIRTQYFKTMVRDSDGQCVFCLSDKKPRNSLHWLIQELSYHGLEKELFKEVIQEAHDRFDKQIENIQKTWETRIEKLVEIGIAEAKKRFDEHSKKYNKTDEELGKIRDSGIYKGIGEGVEYSKYFWNNTEELKKRTNINDETVLKRMLVDEIYSNMVKNEQKK